MNNSILKYTIPYLSSIMKGFEVDKKSKPITFSCPLCLQNNLCMFIPNTDYEISCFKCGVLGNIYNIVKAIRKENLDDDKIENHIKNKLNLDIITSNDVKKLFEFYKENNFDLVPIVKGQKAPAIEKDFFNKKHKDIKEWQSWYEMGLNFAIKTGEQSGITVLDFDTNEIPNEILEMKGNPLIQKTGRGLHFIYKYNENLQTTSIEELKLDILNGKKMVLCSPSIIGEHNRKYITKLKLEDIPKELKDFLLKQKKSVRRINHDTELTKIKNDIINNKVDLKEMQEGSRNNFLIKFGGILRKHLNLYQTGYVLNIVNSNFCKPPLPKQELLQIEGSLDQYIIFDEQELAHKIVDYIEKIGGEASVQDIQQHFMETRKNIDDAVSYLLKEGFLLKRGRGKSTYYQSIKKFEWRDTFMKESGEIDFEMPFFHDFVKLRYGDMLVIGGKRGTGKCVTDGLLLTNQGFVDIEDIGANKPEGISKITKHMRIFNGQFNKNYRHPNYFYKEKVNHTIKIKTKHGYELEGTLEHPIMIVNKKGKHEFKKLSEMSLNDSALMSIGNKFKTKDIRKRDFFNYKKLKHDNNSKQVNIPKRLTPELAKLFGYIIGDGSVQTSCISIYQNINETENIKEIMYLVKKLGLTTTNKKEKNCIRIMIFSKVLANLVRLKCFNSKKHYGNICSPYREIPKCILKGDKEIQINFISALFSCESSLSQNSLEITMASEKLIKQLHLMLLNLGIISNLSEKKVKTYPDKVYYRIFISKGMTNKFFKLLKPIKYKNVKLNKLKIDYLKKNFIGNNQTIKDYYFRDKIISVEHCYDEKYVYDFNIENLKYNKNNQFWCNGFINHNTHLAMNIIKNMVKQGVKPHYISLESGSRFASIAIELGLKEGDFNWCVHFKPEEVELEENAVTILDWLLPDNYAETDKLYKYFAEQLSKKGGILIILVQLKKDGSFFAENMLEMFPAMTARFLYESNTEGRNSYFLIEKRREPRNLAGAEQVKVPCIYDRESKELVRVNTIDNKEERIHEEPESGVPF